MPSLSSASTTTNLLSVRWIFWPKLFITPPEIIVGLRPEATRRYPRIEVVDVFPCEPETTIVNLSLQIRCNNFDLLKNGMLFFFANFNSGLFLIADE